jgi:ribonuclease HI
MAQAPLLTIHTDGASRGNPGESAYAYVIERAGHPPIEEAGRLGKMTNNQAEYAALLRALEHAHELGTHHRLVIHSDSELMVKQVKGEYKVKNSELQALCEEAREMCDSFKEGVALVYVPRSRNKRADALCNEALDGKRRPTDRKATAQPPTAEVEPPAASPQSLKQEVQALLHEAEQAWRRGDELPTVETVWHWILEVLARHQAPSI